MDKNEIIERLERLARCAVHTVGELPFVMSLDDGIAIHEAIDMLRSQSEPHWIPCSRKVPEERGMYLTTTIDKEVYCDYWNGVNFDRTELVIAWLPLPSHYEGDSDGSNQ